MWTSGIYFDGADGFCNNNIISNNNFKRNSIAIDFNGDWGYCNNNTISNNNLTSISNDAICFDGDSGFCNNNTISTNNYTSDPIAIDFDGDTRCCNNNIIAQNTFSKISSIAIYFYAVKEVVMRILFLTNYLPLFRLMQLFSMDMVHLVTITQFPIAIFQIIQIM